MANNNRTLAELSAAVRTEMTMNPGLISDIERKQFLNDCLSDIGSLTLLEKTADFTSVDGALVMPDDFVGIVWLRLDGVPLTAVPASVVMAEGSPTGFILTYDKILLYPKPLSPVTCTMYYAYRPAVMVADTDKPDIPNGFDALLVDYAVAKAYRKNGEIGLFREYMAYYQDGRARLGAELVRRYNSRVVQAVNQTEEPTVRFPEELLF